METGIKLEFIRQTLQKRGEQIKKTMREGIHYNHYNGSGTMESGIATEVTQKNNAEGTLSISAAGYLRIQDIYATRKSESAQMEKKKSNNPYNIKRKGFYTKTIYGYLTPIIRDLSFGLTQDVVEDIRENFNTNGNG